MQRLINIFNVECYLLSSRWHKTCMKEPANTQHNTQHKKAIFT